MGVLRLTKGRLVTFYLQHSCTLTVSRWETEWANRIFLLLSLGLDPLSTNVTQYRFLERRWKLETGRPSKIGFWRKLLIDCGFALPNGDLIISVTMNGVNCFLRSKDNFKCFWAVMNASDRAEVDVYLVFSNYNLLETKIKSDIKQEIWIFMFIFK